jgi:hypothetical protein
MKKNRPKKITLNKETLRILEEVEIRIAGGGDRADYSGSCAGSVCSVVSCPSAC